MCTIENFSNKVPIVKSSSSDLLIFPAAAYYTDISQAEPGKSIWGWVPYFTGF